MPIEELHFPWRSMRKLSNNCGSGAVGVTANPTAKPTNMPGAKSSGQGNLLALCLIADCLPQQARKNRRYPTTQR